MSLRLPWKSDRGPCEELRRSFEAQRADPIYGSAVAGEWARCASDYGLNDEAATAYLHLVHELPRQLELRYSLAAAIKVSREMQGVAAEAAYWLTSVGRFREAVVALEQARAALLEQRAGRIPIGLESELLHRGRDCEWKHFQAAAKALEQYDRQELELLKDSVQPAGQEQVRRADLGLALHTEYRRQSSVVAAALGRPRARVDVAIVERIAAHLQHPLVYVFAAERGGGAIRLSPGADVTVTKLPSLTAATARTEAGVFSALAGQKFPDIQQWGQALTRVGVLVMEPVLRLLRSATCATLVPIGALALVPLHAATVQARAGTPHASGDPVTAADVVPLCYAPSGRALTHARSSRPPGGVTRLAALSAPTASGLPELHNADGESKAVGAIYDCGDRVFTRASVAVARHELPRSRVWHLACHAVADPGHPLAGALLLSDGRLTLADLLADPPKQTELAFLSACSTGVPSHSDLDATISFASVLLTAGVRVVVATAWEVSDAAAFLFATRFHRLLTEGLSPEEACPAAARWLRTSDNGVLDEFAPGVLPDPFGGRTPEWRASRDFEDPTDWAAFTVHGPPSRGQRR